MDEAGVDALKHAIRKMHGLEATRVESVPVHEAFEGKTVWRGEAQIFEVTHPKARRCYACWHETEAGRRRFYAVLGSRRCTVR